VARIGAAAVATPVRAGLVGLAAQAVFVPALIVVAIVMAITIVGLPFVAIVPLAGLVMLATMVLGLTSLAARPARSTGNDTVVSVLAGSVIADISRACRRGFDALRVVTVTLLVSAPSSSMSSDGPGAAVMTGLVVVVVPPPVPPRSMSGDPVVEPSAVL
jgi:hypothetical protein